MNTTEKKYVIYKKLKVFNFGYYKETFDSKDIKMLNLNFEINHSRNFRYKNINISLNYHLLLKLQELKLFL